MDVPVELAQDVASGDGVRSWNGDRDYDPGWAHKDFASDGKDVILIGEHQILPVLGLAPSRQDQMLGESDDL